MRLIILSCLAQCVLNVKCIHIYVLTNEVQSKGRLIALYFNCPYKFVAVEAYYLFLKITYSSSCQKTSKLEEAADAKVFIFKQSTFGLHTFFL